MQKRGTRTHEEPPGIFQEITKETTLDPHHEMVRGTIMPNMAEYQNKIRCITEKTVKGPTETIIRKTDQLLGITEKPTAILTIPLAINQQPYIIQCNYNLSINLRVSSFKRLW